MDVLRYSDPETLEPVDIDVTGWQLVIDTDAGEVMRLGLVQLALLTTQIVRLTPAPFGLSLVALDGFAGVLRAPGEPWWDIRIERR